VPPPHARGGTLRPPVPDQPRPPAADGGADRGGPAEDPPGEREPVAGAGVGGAVGGGLRLE
jgi:hypothetical protein